MTKMDSPSNFTKDQDARNRANHNRFAQVMGDGDVADLEGKLMSATNLAGTFYPEARSENGFALYAMSPELKSRPVTERLPPNSLRHYYGVRDGTYRDDLYLQSGRTDVAVIRKLLSTDGFQLEGNRILEFGCSAGRLLRHFEEEAKTAEVWGADLHSAAIHWAQSHLSPPFHFLTNTTAPHLPFENGYFGFIFAGSVWTHLGELDDAWLLELKRVLRVGGRIYLTISDQDTLAEIARINPDHPSNAHVTALDSETGHLSQNWVSFTTRRTPWLQRVVYQREAWLEHIGRWLDVRVVKPKAYGWQTGILLSKREGSRE